MNKGAKWFLAMVIAAFLSFISFVHIDSFIADKYHFNIGFMALGIVFAIATIFCLVKVTTNSN